MTFRLQIDRDLLGIRMLASFTGELNSFLASS
jgi:hypothetical protein